MFSRNKKNHSKALSTIGNTTTHKCITHVCLLFNAFCCGIIINCCMRVQQTVYQYLHTLPTM